MGLLAQKVVGAARPSKPNSYKLENFLAQPGRGNVFKAAGFLDDKRSVRCFSNF
jgi:hypothetical protein